MKSVALVFLLIFIFSANAVFAQISAQRVKEADWSALFPEIAGCERVVQPLTQNGEIFEQTAVYETRINSDENRIYYGCGSITLRFEPSARKSADKIYANSFKLFLRKGKIKTFDAYTSSPQCGNDEWRGSTSVYFDEDKVLIVSAKRGAGNILDFVETADYELMKATIDNFIKTKNKKF